MNKTNKSPTTHNWQLLKIIWILQCCFVVEWFCPYDISSNKLAFSWAVGTKIETLSLFISRLVHRYEYTGWGKMTNNSRLGASLYVVDEWFWSCCSLLQRLSCPRPVTFLFLAIKAMRELLSQAYRSFKDAIVVQQKPWLEDRMDPDKGCSIKLAITAFPQ